LSAARLAAAARIAQEHFDEISAAWKEEHESPQDASSPPRATVGRDRVTFSARCASHFHSLLSPPICSVH
jgi:hypothetical protein